MKLSFVAAIVLAGTAVHAQQVAVVLLNAGHTDVVVEAKDKSAVAELMPMKGAKVTLRQPQWLKLGQEVYRFNIHAILKLRQRSNEDITIQVAADGRLYLMAPGASEPGSAPPAQPNGFPLRPTKKVDLT